MSSSYWNSQIAYLQANPPQEASSFYNQSFVDKINEAQANIDNAVAEKNKSWSEQNQKMDTYNAFSGSMSSYGDVYKNNEDEFGVQEAKDTYENSKKALAMTEMTLDALPSSINSASNRVLNQSQREARYNTLSNKWATNTTNIERQTTAYEEAWKNAREQQAEKTSSEISQQWNTLSNYGNVWANAMNTYNTNVQNWETAKSLKWSWESQYRDWQYQQRSIAHSVWLSKLSSAYSRWSADLQTELAQSEANLQKKLADSDARIAASKQELAQSLVNSYYKQQEAYQKAEVLRAGGKIGDLAYLASGGSL